ncbi:heterokaryon incompatibility protein-domain-containing protein [Leptodontidium sp. MPI-SDFR-AT-0119]|nr:heterokaryon incompatibility protein-domain-containing protein [Leptodontidium sp. MPI-SDFR-AT-0119]
MEPVERALETRLSPYKYKQLPTVRSCRLIRLKRKLHRRTKAVVVELVEADIDHPPIYNALSYAWDSPQPNSFVICSGCAIPVTINCQEALKKLRKCDSGQLLFVDAICINQSSTEEKNHQVAAMGDIYTNAQKVICWIGNISHSLVEWESRLNHFIFRKIDSLGRWMNPLSHFFWAHSCALFLSRDRRGSPK